MSRYQLSQPGQPLVQRILLGIVDFAASLKLAVVLIMTCALGLGWATFVESEYGTPAVQYGVYGSPLFTVLLLLLAINIFTAAAVRFPWKKHQTGFVITHIGLLTLLFGCFLTRRGWIDAQMPVFEDHIGTQAYTDEHHFKLTLLDKDNPDQEKILEIPFQAGPFNWHEHDDIFRPVGTDPVKAEEFNLLEKIMNPISLAWRNTLRTTSGLAFAIAHRDQGVVYEDEEHHIKLEVLDYYAHSRQAQAPLVKLGLSMPGQQTFDEDGKPIEAEPTWVPVMLHINEKYRDFDDFRKVLPEGVGVSRQMGGGKFTFRVSSSPAETEAFLNSAPEGELDEAGQVVLYADGETHRFDVTELEKSSDRLPLADSGLEIMYLDREAHGMLGPAIRLMVFRDGKPVGRLNLTAEMPEWNVQLHDPENEVYGAYWIDQSKKSNEEVMAGQGGARIDVLLGDDSETVYYRNWNREEVVAVGELPTDGTELQAFKMPFATLKMRVDEFIPKTATGIAHQPIPFDINFEKRSAHTKRPAVKLRLTLGEGTDQTSKEFWLTGLRADGLEVKPGAGEIETLTTGDEHVTIVMPRTDAFVNANFQVRLNKFHRKLDPGTEQAAHYGSTIDILSREPLGKSTLLTKNDAERGLVAGLTDTVELPEEVDIRWVGGLRRGMSIEEAGSGLRVTGGSGDPLPTPGEEITVSKAAELLREDVSIVMNNPYDMVDPVTGRTYRLFQESFNGPWKPGDPFYNQLADTASGRENFYLSVFTVNYDPGRAAKYLGCLLICVGIFTMFYMRAYFFKPAGKSKSSAAGDEPGEAEAIEEEANASDDQHRKEKHRVATPSA